jgi:hypothetical protein
MSTQIDGCYLYERPGNAPGEINLRADSIFICSPITPVSAFVMMLLNKSIYDNNKEIEMNAENINYRANHALPVRKF